MQGTRLERIAHQLLKEIALIVQRELKDPRLGFVTITRVEPSRDLHYAKVYFSCLGEQKAIEQSQKALESSCGFIHELLKKRVRIKFIPTLIFRYDPSIEQTVTLSEAFERARQQPSPRDEEEQAA